MPNPVTPARSTKIPDDVIIRSEARRPETDPTLGIPVTVDRQGTPHHRLVTIGDSVTQGFQSGAIFKTSLSYPAIIANAMGWEQFRYPTYDSPGGGLPLNLENLARQLEQRFGDNLDWYELPAAATFVQGYLDQIEDYWERGAGSIPPDSKSAINHNLAVYGWDLRNTLSRNADVIQAILKMHPAKDNLLGEIVEYHNERAALRVLNSARDSIGNALSPLQAAAQLSREGSAAGTGTVAGTGTADGIETLIVAIGANNALGSILTFSLIWSDVGYDDMAVNDKYTVWRPIHFQAELDRLVSEVKKIQARHVIFSTVPHVTIAPYARGVDRKVNPKSRYFPFYTLPWISDAAFTPNKHPNLTEQDARAIDSAIDQYNDSITEAVRSARRAGKDWYLFDLCGVLDRVAYRRYLTPESAAAKPSWWDAVGGKYELPAVLRALQPELDSRFFSAGANGRIQGGLFALDGIHPTTVGYGIVAQELIKVMQRAGVKFYEADGITERQGEVKLDFQRLLALDTLVSKPPRSIAGDLALLRWLDETFNVFGRLLKASF